MGFSGVAVAALLAAGPLAPGQLDLTFSGDGTLRSRFGVGDEVAAEQVVPLSSGRLAVLTSARSVVRLRAAGRPDATFGRRGVARPGVPYPSAMAGTPDGGLVVAGTLRADGLVVARHRRDGRPDRRFGRAGRVRVEAPLFLDGIDVEVTPDGTALVAMRAVAPYPSATPPRLLVYALDPAGRLVTGFGEGGVAQLPYRASGTRPLLRLPDGRLRYVASRYDEATRRYPVVLAGLTADGKPDTAVGPGGAREIATPAGAHLSGVALDAFGRLLLTAVRGPGRGRIVVDALTSEGQRDATYGTGGIARIALPFAIDAGGSAALDGGRVAVSVLGLGRGRRGAVVLLDRSGRLVRSFGRRGVAVVGGFPGRRRVELPELAVDRLGRLVLGGLSGDGLSSIRDDFGRDWVALARIRTRRPALSLPARAAVSRSGVARLRVRCRASNTCQAALSARGRRVVVRVRSNAVRVVELRLGPDGARLAARGRQVRLTATIAGAGRIETVAVRVRLRRTGGR